MGGRAHAPASRRAPIRASLEFRVSFDKAAYIPSDQISVRFALKNLGKRPVWVNKRFHTQFASRTVSAREKKPGREVILTITSPAGKAMSCTPASDVGLPKSDDVVLLQPGQEAVSEPQNLRGSCEFQERGTYRIVGVYGNVFGEEIGLPVFNGSLKAQPVSMTITE